MLELQIPVTVNDASLGNPLLKEITSPPAMLRP
jgi:hypothetical protein